MATVKNLNSTYTIGTPKGSNVVVNTDWVIINGNLNVLGNTSTVNTTDTNVLDNFIVLNYGEAGAGVTKGNAGISIDRGTSPDVAIRWTEANGGSWQITSDGSTYANILAGVGGSGLTAIVQDTNPALGGNLNTNGFGLGTIGGTNTYFAGNLQMLNTATIPSSSQPNSVVVYATTVGGGKTGIYVVNGSSANQELITKRRAFGFSLLF